MSALNDLTVGFRTVLRGRGLVCPAPSAAASDHTVILTVRQLTTATDADGETPAGAVGGGAVNVAVSMLVRASVAGDTDWIGTTLETIEASIGSIRNQVVGGIPVTRVMFDYSADLGFGDRGRPESSVQYRAWCALPVLA